MRTSRFGDSDGPSDEGSLCVVFGELAEENHRDLLEQVLGLLEIRHDGVNVAGDDGLGFGPAAGELFVVVHTGWSRILTLPPAANRYMKSGTNAKQGTKLDNEPDRTWAVTTGSLT